MKLWKVIHPNYMIVIVVAETKKDAVELAKSRYPAWKDSKLTTELMCDDIRDGFVSDQIDVM